MQQIKTSIIPTEQTFVKKRGELHELDKEAICVFIATGFFLDTDTYWKDEIVLPPASINTIDDEGFLIESKPWFKWHYTPKQNSFSEVLESFSSLFEGIINEQTSNKKVILPLSGGLDSRTQAVALHKIDAKVYSYSYHFKNGYKESKIAKQIALECNFPFKDYQIEEGYLWNVIEELTSINKCYSDFTHPRQMAIYNQFEKMGDIFSLGHWGDVFFDSDNLDKLSIHEEIKILKKKILKNGGLQLAESLWQFWELPNNFETYLEKRIGQLLKNINISDSNAKIRAFKSMYWAPRWTAVNLSVFNKKHPMNLPYFDDRMCQFICTVPEKYLANRKIQIEYIKQNNQNLAKITWQENKPFHLNNYYLNKLPYNLPYRVANKIKRELDGLLGKKFIQRNWELQFLGKANETNLKKYLFDSSLQKTIPLSLIEDVYQKFKNKNQLKYSHPVSMLLTLSLFFEQNENIKKELKEKL
ncbi:MAG: asparagine synthetase B family protein [Flavobacteriaceae bacterium]|nr:asparagine synthetase B family protein [Flavobacteriaceae bacterium]